MDAGLKFSQYPVENVYFAVRPAVYENEFWLQNASKEY